jgi:hypothetical protein
MTAEREAKLNVLGFVWEKRASPSGLDVNTIPSPDEIRSKREKRQSPASAGSNENHVFCPDEVRSADPTINRRRSNLEDISTEVRSNDRLLTV